jgi:prophage endopeptidase
MGGVKLAIAAGALAVAFGAGWAVNGWRVGTKVADLKASHAQAVETAATAAAAQLAAAYADRDAKQDELNRIAADGLANLKKANDETERLRRCVADGSCGLRIRATCPANPPGVPTAADGASVGAGTGAVLDTAAGQDYFALRANIARTEETLTTCQKALQAFGPVLATTPAGQSSAQ